MKWLLLLTLGGSVAQSSLVQALSVGGATPDLPFILTVFWALRVVHSEQLVFAPDPR